MYENFNKTVENTELEIGVDINLTNEKVDADLGVLVCHSGSGFDGQYLGPTAGPRPGDSIGNSPENPTERTGTFTF